LHSFTQDSKDITRTLGGEGRRGPKGERKWIECGKGGAEGSDGDVMGGGDWAERIGQ